MINHKVMQRWQWEKQVREFEAAPLKQRLNKPVDDYLTNLSAFTTELGRSRKEAEDQVVRLITCHHDSGMLRCSTKSIEGP